MDLVRPEETPSAPVRELAMALVGLLPGASMIQMLLNQLWEEPRFASQRRFALGLAAKIEELQRAGEVDLQAALARPEAQPLLIHAFDAAAKSLGERKLEALQNVAMSGIFLRQYEFDASVMVFALLDRLTEGHLRILQAVRRGFEKHGASAPPVRAMFPWRTCRPAKTQRACGILKSWCMAAAALSTDISFP